MDRTRAAYRRAINHVVSNGQVPRGQTLTYTGRDGGVMTIRVAPVKSQTDAPQPIGVAEVLTSQHPVTDSLGHDGDLLPVSEASRDRALRIIEVIVMAALERGWHAEVRPDREPGFRLHSGEDVVDLMVREEFAPATTYDPGAVGEVKYAWQRITPQVTDVATGRLRIDVVTGWSWDKGSFWADRKRWTLESRLGRLVRQLEQNFQRARDLRIHAEDQKRERIAEWEAAVPRALERYLRSLNRERLEAQVARHAKAESLRRYSDHLERAVLLDAAAERREDVREWVSFARQEADRLDPSRDVDELRFTRPSAVPHRELDKYMPSGMTSRTPPE